MKPMFRKLLPMLLAVCLTVTFLPLTALAEGEPPVMQSAVVTADGHVELTFDKAMAEPESGAAGFTVKFSATDKQVTAAQLNGTDSKKIQLTLTTTIKGGEDVWMSYAAGTVAAADGGLLAGISYYSLSNSLPRPILVTTQPPEGTVGTAYTHTFDVVGNGTEPYTFTSSGVLPTGLVLDSATGVLSGTPTESGSFSIGIYIEDSNSAIDSRGWTIKINEESNVCEIGAEQYATLDLALAAAPTGNATATVIMLLQDIDYAGGITITNKKITFDLDGKTLTVNNTSGAGLTVTNGSVVDIASPGELNVTGSTTGLSVNNSTVTVTNVTSGTLHGILAGNNSVVTVTNDVTSAAYMAAAASGGSKISIGGSASGTNYSVYAQDAGTVITVTGNVSAAGNNSCGVHSRGGADVTIHGNITATGSGSIGANLNTGGLLTVNGMITAQKYIILEAVEKTAADKTTPTTKPNYNTYTDGVSTVWVAITNYVCEIDGELYETLDDALAVVDNGETITLLTDITDNDGIVINNGKSFILDLDEYDLTVTKSGDMAKGLEVINSSNVALAGSGVFSVSGSTYGVYADKATVTVSEATASNGTAVVAFNSANVTVTGNAEGTSGGIFVRDSNVTVYGDVSSTDSGTVAVNSQHTKTPVSNTIHVFGSVIASGGSSSHGILGSGHITVDRNVEGNQIGVQVDGSSSVITVGGNVTARGTDSVGFLCYGALTTGGDINISGNITAAGGTGVRSTGGGKLTLDGTITAAHYIEFGFGVTNTVKTIDDMEAVTTKPGYYTYAGTVGAVWVKAPATPSGVCKIGAAQYPTLDAALAVVDNGETITLLENITDSDGLVIDNGKSFTIDLDGKTLAVTNSSGIGLWVKSGHVDYTGPGAFNVTGATCGVSVDGSGAAATVTNATATSDGGNGAVALNGGSLTVKGNAQGGYNGVVANGATSTAVINGNATGTASDSSGAMAGFGGHITVNNGTVQGVMYGAYANGAGSQITVNSGNAIGTGASSHGAHAEGSGSIYIDGNVQGTQYGIDCGIDSTVEVTGNVTVTAAVNGWGVNSTNGGTIEIGGNVTAAGSSIGVYAAGGSKITIDGAILASNYIWIYDNIQEASVYKDGSAASRTNPTTKTDYYTYSAGTSTVWVKESSTPATTVTSFTLSPTSLPQSGGTVTAAVTGANLEAAGTNLKVSLDGGTTKIGTVSNNTGSTAHIEFAVPANTTATDRTDTVTLYLNGAATGHSATVTVTAAQTPTYALTVVNGTGSGSYAGGSQVSITANTAPSGQVFDRWATSGGGSFAGVSSMTTTFTMPAAAVTVTATYRSTGSGNGGGSGNSSGGDESPPAPAALQELNITLTIGNSVIIVDGQAHTLDAAPFINSESGRTFVPLRFISEALGADVEWLEATRQIVIQYGETKIILTIDSAIVLVNSVEQTIDAPPEILPPGRTFVPLRFISEILGARVDYDSITRQITITR